MQAIRAGVVQFEHAAGGKETNFAKIERFVREAASHQVRLLAFPECCVTGYWFLRNLTPGGLYAIAEPVPQGPSTRRLLDLACECEMTIGAGWVESDGNRLFNTYVVAMPNGQVRRHRKIQAFEHECISAGSEYTVFDTPEGVKVGVLICYDNNLIENVRVTALMGAQVLLAPHQTGGCNSISPHAMKPIDPAIWHARETEPDAIRKELLGPNGKEWLMRWLPSRAHDNGLFVLFANGIGLDDDEVRTGNSMILDPYGRVLAHTDEPADRLVIADLDLSLIPLSTGRRWIRARRPELYQPLTRLTGAELNTRDVRFGRDAGTTSSVHKT
ncbi:MAG TPA: nitrilase family protein [Tepidisphaeraceae bacterium]|nr:nitrilase family protein [Tepidisphaeraceae bacterium]